MKGIFPHIYRKSNDGRGCYYLWFSAMHTRIDAMLVGHLSEDEFEPIGKEICEAVHYIEHLASCFDPASELSKVNREAAEHPVETNEELILILRLCKEYYRLTGGLFDITQTGQVDDLLLESDRQVAFASPLKVNLSGFLKGYALENIRSILSEHGISDALVSIGQSSIMAIGSHSGTNGWEVVLSNGAASTPPQEESGRKTVTLFDECLTTSGNNSDDRRHIVDTQTGEVIEGKRAVAVVTKSGIEGEALSTAFFIADAERREQLKEQFGIKIVVEI